MPGLPGAPGNVVCINRIFAAIISPALDLHRFIYQVLS